jgi:hypothetical protein
MQKRIFNVEQHCKHNSFFKVKRCLCPVHPPPSTPNPTYIFWLPKHSYIH